MMMAKGKYIPPSLRAHGITGYCNWCKSTFTDLCKEFETTKSIKKCPHGDFHKIKVVVYGDKGKRTKILDNVVDLDDAVTQAIEFKREIKEDKTNLQLQVSKTPNRIDNAFARYIAYLRNENVPEHLQIERTEGHIKDVEHFILEAAEIWTKNKFNPAKHTIQEIDDQKVGFLFSAFKQRNLKPRTINKFLTYGSSIIKWFCEEYYPVKNPFAKAPRLEVTNEPQAITSEEWKKLLETISKENGIKEYDQGKNTKRWYYRPYSRFAFEIALGTGLRKEELAMLRWPNIHYDTQGTPLYFKIVDLKATRISKRKQKVKYIPITNSLRKILTKNGMNENKNTNDYIIAPEEANRNTIKDNFSRSFSQFFEHAESDRQLTFKSLRKAYITELKIYLANINHITGHSNESVIDRHYIDPARLAAALKHFEVFPEQRERTKALTSARMKKSKKQLYLDR